MREPANTINWEQAMSHETDERLNAMLSRNPGNQDLAYLIEQYKALQRAYDTLQASIAHLLELNLIRPEDAARLTDEGRGDPGQSAAPTD